jgi:hypothetical protein
MMRFHRRSITALIAMLGSTGCAAEVVSANCVDVAYVGIALSFEDSSTGARYPFMDVVAVASEGAFRDTARAASITGDPHSRTGVGLVIERAGTYDLTVQAAGYTLWTASNVRVREEDNPCRHVITRTIVARLQAMP